MTQLWFEAAIALAMAGHSRLGASSALRPVAAKTDLLRSIMRFIQLVVPDDVPNLMSAMARAAAGQVNADHHAAPLRQSLDRSATVRSIIR